MPSTHKPLKMPRVSTYQPPSKPPAIDSAKPMFTLTRPICWLLKPESTQNGLTMNPIDASPSLNSRMKIRIASMPGRDSNSTQAPNTGPSRMSCARGWRAAVTISAAPMNISATGSAPLNQPDALHCTTVVQPATLATGANTGHSSPRNTSASAAIHSGWSRSRRISVRKDPVVETRGRSGGANSAITALPANTAPPTR